MLHGDNLTPHRAIWVLATISALIGAYGALYYFGGGSAPDDKIIATLPHNIWYSIGISSNASLASLPNGLLLVTLLSNFGTFLLYGLTNIVCIIAFNEHHEFSGFKHMVVPIFGAIANFSCLAFYIIGPLMGLAVPKSRSSRLGSRWSSECMELSTSCAIRRRKERARSWWRSRSSGNIPTR